jgi:DNA-binding LacI/PurR family transcriptional regulator
MGVLLSSCTESRQSFNQSPTIRDVARLASLSTATVSRTLSSPEKVRPETRDKVLSAILSCGYKPNEHAQRLGRLRGG